ncbi:SPOCS domain-containing protein [Romboutsia lituseburensis]|uniref:SipL SPOCS domain-containing protein n=1 Tax=Romboutsia lituseburensis DSM 797 TaxID=1121325 RepID=A0A1G9T9U7_9FIRM|nr:SPOCS domain-containing protein [Romboutsia lituseburensis]CEH36162.1 Domain of unknown function (DUF3794) [Romboutsia lituseburensis]SDM44382.1 protein of unknown function [Romboutsia lituseburensis DSM 797]
MDCNKNVKCGCDFNIKTVGTCDVSRITINGSNRSDLNWTEISVPEILSIPDLKPDIEEIDQVYANVILDNIKLIETPFAYKSYVLFSFYNAANDLTGTLTDLIIDLTGTVGDVTDILSNDLTTLLTDLLDALNLIPIKPPGLAALITVVQQAITTIANLVDSIDQALAAVVTAANNLLAAILTVPFSAELICQAVKTLTDTLTTLSTLINSIVGIINGLLNAISAAAAGIPGLGTLISDLITAVNNLITALLTPAIAAVNAAITAILNALLPVNCDQSSAFEIIPNAEGTCLSGRKLIIEGILKQKVVYTAEVDIQSVHSAHYEVPFIAFIIPYAKFEGLEYEEGIQVYDPETGGPKLINGYIYSEVNGINVDLCEEFNVEKCIEDIYVYPLDLRRIFKNVTIFLKAKPSTACN